MAVERTLSIIKPDAVAKNYIGEIYSRFEANDLRIVAAKMTLLTKQQVSRRMMIWRSNIPTLMLITILKSKPIVLFTGLLKEYITPVMTMQQLFILQTLAMQISGII